MANLDGLLANPMFMAGLGLLGSNQWSGAATGLLAAQQGRQALAQSQREQQLYDLKMQEFQAKQQAEADKKAALANLQQTNPLAGQLAAAGITPPSGLFTPPDQPALVQEYDFAKKSGFEGSFTDYIKAKQAPQLTYEQQVQLAKIRGGNDAGGPFSGTSMDAQSMNIVTSYDQLVASGQQPTPAQTQAYEFAKWHLSQPRVVGTAEGGFAAVTPPPLPGMAPPAPAPAGGQPPGPQPLPQPTITPVTESGKLARERDAAFAELDRTEATFDALGEKIDKYGLEVVPGAPKAETQTAYMNAVAQLRVLFNTGVLQPGEWPMLAKSVADPTSVWSAPGGSKAIKAQITELKSELGRARKVLEDKYRSGVVLPPGTLGDPLGTAGTGKPAPLGKGDTAAGTIKFLGFER